MTTYNINFQAYKVYAVTEREPTNRMGYREALMASSPDSSDQRLFLAIFRTLQPDSTNHAGAR